MWTASIKPGERHRRASCDVAAREPDDPSGGTLRSLASLLRNSTIGVALFDRNLHCGAFNGALRTLMGVSAKKHIDKQLQHIFLGGVPKLELALHSVWNSGSALSNIELTAQLPPGTEPRRWLVNFYPIRDESRQVRLVAHDLFRNYQGDAAWNLGSLVSKINSNPTSCVNPTF